MSNEKPDLDDILQHAKETPLEVEDVENPTDSPKVEEVEEKNTVVEDSTEYNEREEGDEEDEEEFETQNYKLEVLFSDSEGGDLRAIENDLKEVFADMNFQIEYFKLTKVD